MTSLDRRRLDTRGLEWALAGLGLVCLAWWVAVFASSAAYQDKAARTLERWRLEVGRSPVTRAMLPRRTLVSLTGVVGRIEIPRARISAMIADGDDDRTLARAVGHLPGSPLPGDPGRSVLAGHRDTFFRGLGRVHPGDSITIDTGRSMLRYRVVSTRVLTPHAAELAFQDRGDGLLLVTCYPFYFVGPAPMRFIVSAMPA